MTNKNEGKTMGIGAEMAREGYEASVISRMTGRAGAYSPKGAVDNVVDGISDFVGGLFWWV